MFSVRCLFVPFFASQCFLAFVDAGSLIRMQRAERQVPVAPLHSAVVDTVEIQDTVVAPNGVALPLVSQTRTQITPLAPPPTVVVETVETDDTVVSPTVIQVPVSIPSNSQITPVAIGSGPVSNSVVTPLVGTAHLQVPAVQASIVSIAHGTPVFDTLVEQETIIIPDGSELPVNNVHSRSMPLFYPEGMSKREFPDRISFPLPNATLQNTTFLNKPRMFKPSKVFLPLALKKHWLKNSAVLINNRNETKTEVNKMNIIVAPAAVNVTSMEIISTTFATTSPSTIMTTIIQDIPVVVSSTLKPLIMMTAIKQTVLVVNKTSLSRTIDEATTQATTSIIATTRVPTQTIFSEVTTQRPTVKKTSTDSALQIPMSRENAEIYAIASRAELANAAIIFSSTAPSKLVENVDHSILNRTIITTTTRKNETVLIADEPTPVVTTTIQKTQIVQQTVPEAGLLVDEMPPVTKKQLDIAAAKALFEPKSILVVGNSSLPTKTEFADFNARDRFD